MKYKTPYVVLFVSVIMIGFFIWARSGVDDNVKYVNQEVVRLIGCERGSEEQKSQNQLLVQSLRATERSKLTVSENQEAICDIDYGNIKTFDVGFYKRYLIALSVNGRVILSEESGIASYKRSGTFFIAGIVLFNLVAAFLVFVTEPIRKSKGR